MREFSMRLGRMVAVTSCFFAATSALAPAMAAQTGTIAGQVVDRGAEIPLPFSSVAIVGQSVERFAGDSGRFQLTDVPAGAVTLRVRHVGYVPVELQVTVQPGATTNVRVELRHVPVTLAAVRVEESRCTSPGSPSASDSALSTVFEQLQLNAQQYDLVTLRFPYTSVVTRRFSRLLEVGRRTPSDSLNGGADTLDIFTRYDSVFVRSDRPWHYKPGGIITSTTNFGIAHYGVEIPTLAVFADPLFVRSHCFRNAGLAEVDGRPYRRIDFRASEEIHDPDIDGSIYLDPSTFVIGRSVISLSRPSVHAESYESVTVETIFHELLPGVPIIGNTYGRNVLTPDAGRHVSGRDLPAGQRFVSDLERQRLEEIRFLRATPGTPSGGGDMAKVVRMPGAGAKGRIVGVFDAASGAPLPSVQVKDSVSGVSGFTSPTGTLSLTFISREHAVLDIVHPGFVRMSLPISLAPTDTLPITIVLEHVRPPT